MDQGELDSLPVQMRLNYISNFAIKCQKHVLRFQQ